MSQTARQELSPELRALPGAVGAESLPSQLHEILEEAIIAGVLKPGQRVHADHLAARYEVSRIPIREALRSLHAAGWVEIRPRYGVYVRERSAEELTALFEVRAVLEAKAAEWAALRRTDEQLAELQRVVAASKAAAKRGDDTELSIQDTRFYDTLRAAAHNSVMDSTLASMEKRARFYFSTVASELGKTWVNVHAELVDHIAVRDGQKAADLMHEHIVATGQAVGGLLSRDGL